MLGIQKSKQVQERLVEHKVGQIQVSGGISVLCGHQTLRSIVGRNKVVHSVVEPEKFRSKVLLSDKLLISIDVSNII